MEAQYAKERIQSAVGAKLPGGINERKKTYVQTERRTKRSSDSTKKESLGGQTPSDEKWRGPGVKKKLGT